MSNLTKKDLTLIGPHLLAIGMIVDRAIRNNPEFDLAMEEIRKAGFEVITTSNLVFEINKIVDDIAPSKKTNELVQTKRAERKDKKFLKAMGIKPQ